MQSLLSHHWHHLPTAEVAQLLDADLEKGLDRFEVQGRHERFGPNQITPKPGRSPWLRFLLQFHNPLIYVLLAAGGVRLAMGGEVDAEVIVGVALINAVSGYVQEARARRSIEALSQSLVMETAILRGGKTLRIPEQRAPAHAAASIQETRLAAPAGSQPPMSRTFS